MGYMHIDNLYKCRDIFMFRRCYALEKIHGTSAHIQWKQGKLGLFAGGEKQENFVKLFDLKALEAKLLRLQIQHVTIYGEAYGGKLLKMSHTYGNKLRFICFEVKIGEHGWLNVPQAEQFCRDLALEFVHYVEIEVTQEMIDQQRDAPSVQAIRNGVVTAEDPGKIREGIVLRPLMELFRNNGKRIMAKHKRPEFSETRSKRDGGCPIPPPESIVEAKDAAQEWVTVMRLAHVLDKIPQHSIRDMPRIMDDMVQDITRESKGELEITSQVVKSIRQETARLYKETQQEKRGKKPIVIAVPSLFFPGEKTSD